MNTILRALILLATLVGAAQLSLETAQAHADNSSTDLTVSFSDLHLDGPGPIYTFAVIRPRKPSEITAESNRVLAQTLLSTAHDWSLDQIRDRYTHHPAEKFEVMRRAGVRLTANSAFIVVFDKTHPQRPLGTLWTAYPDESGRIDLERSLSWHYPQKSAENSSYPRFEIVKGQVVGISEAVEKVGGVVEMKRLVMEPSAPRELMPAMLLRGESHDRLNTQPIAFEKTPAGESAIYPRDYALRCDRKLIPIYRRLGFKLVQEEAIQGDYVMSIDRTSYVRHAMKFLTMSRAAGWQIRFNEDKKIISSLIEGQIRTRLNSRACERLFNAL